MNKTVQPDSENGSIQLPFRQKKHSCQCCCCLTHTPYTFWGPHLSHSSREAGSIICANMSEPSGKKRKNIASPADHHTAWTSVVTQALPTSQSFPDIIRVWILTSSIDQEYFNTHKKKKEVCSPLAWQSTERQCRSWLLLDTWLLCKVFVFVHLIQQINRAINLCAKLVPLGLVVSSGTQVQRGKSKDTQKCTALPWQSQG